MKLQDQTCSRVQGARLVELGVKPDALFWHMPAKDGPHAEYIQYGWSSEALAPAFTVAELGNRPLCPDYTVTWFAYGYWWWCDLRTENPFTVSTRGQVGRKYPTEAQARAAMIIDLIVLDHMFIPEECRYDATNQQEAEIFEDVLIRNESNYIPAV